MNYNWENTLINPKSSIKHALEIINNEALRVALVVDDNKKLLGVITDGDIRRGLLQDLSLNDPASSVMKVSPVTAKFGTSKEELISVMKAKSILAIPLIDETGTVIGLETFHNALRQPRYDNPVLIMAGGFGSRLKPLTDDCPKPMLKIGNKPILETIIKNFVKSGFHHFYLSTHYMPEIIEDYFGDGSDFGIKITYIHEKEPLGTGGALGLLPKDKIGDLPLILMNADILTNMNFERLLQFHANSGAAATMCVREYEYQIPYGVVNGDKHVIKSIREKPIERFFVNAGIYVLSKKIIESVPQNSRIDMPTLLDAHIKNENIHMFPIHEYWLDIGKIDDFNRAQVDINGLGLPI